jgi:hypothetical protein
MKRGEMIYVGTQSRHVLKPPQYLDGPPSLLSSIGTAAHSLRNSMMVKAEQRLAYATWVLVILMYDAAELLNVTTFTIGIMFISDTMFTWDSILSRKAGVWAFTWWGSTYRAPSACGQ